MRAPQTASAGLYLLRRVGVVDPADLDAYRAHGGYAALRRALELGPAAGDPRSHRRGAHGPRRRRVPHRAKWDAVAAPPERPHYLVCNADESEPGTFKDRVLMEADPFALIEAMTIAGFAAGCERGFLYVRGEYPVAERGCSTPSRRRATPGFSATTSSARARVRHRDPPRRRRLHLRRGDRALQFDRGPPRRAAEQAAVPAQRAVREAHRRSTTSRRW